jgi:hypothetical protein
MNNYDLEIYVKERQRDLEDEFKHIHLPRAVRNPGNGFLKKFILGFRAISLPKGSMLCCFKNRRSEK